MIALFAGVFWVITELNCNKYLILGHSVWHFCIAYGMHLFIQFINTIKCNKVACSSVFSLQPKRVLGFVPILGQESI